MAVPYNLAPSRTQDRIARAVGVQLPDGRRWRNGVLISAGDAGAADATRARDAAFDTQARSQAIQDIPSQAGTISTFDNRALGFLDRARPDGRIDIRQLPASRLGPQPPATAWSGGQSLGLPGGGGGVASMGTLQESLAALRRNAGAVPGRDYTERSLGVATPEQIMAEAQRLPALIGAQRTLMDAGRAGIFADRNYTAEALGRATPEQVMAEALGLGQRISFRDLQRRNEQEAAMAAAFGGGAGMGGEAQRINLPYREGVDGLPQSARPVSPAGVAPAAGLPGDDVESFVSGAVQRFLGAGGNPAMAAQVAQNARLLADPTGDLTYQRQVARDEARADAAQRRADLRVQQTDARADEAAAYYLGQNDRLDTLQDNFLRVTAPTAAQQASALAEATNIPELTGPIDGRTRRRIRTAADIDTVLAGNPQLQARVRGSYDEAESRFRQQNATTPAALRVTQQLEAQTRLINTLNSSVNGAAIGRVLRQRAQSQPAATGGEGASIGREDATAPGADVASAAALTAQDVADFAAMVRGEQPEEGAEETRFANPGYSALGIGQRAAHFAPAGHRMVVGAPETWASAPDYVANSVLALGSGLWRGDYTTPESVVNPIDRMSRWFGREVLGGLIYGPGERRALAETQRAQRETAAEMARQLGNPRQALADLRAARRAAEGNRLPVQDRADLAASLGLPTNAGTLAISRAAIAREQELRRSIGSN